MGVACVNYLFTHTTDLTPPVEGVNITALPSLFVFSLSIVNFVDAMLTFDVLEHDYSFVSHSLLERAMQSARLPEKAVYDIRLMFHSSLLSGLLRFNTSLKRYMLGTKCGRYVENFIRHCGLFEAIPVNRWGSMYSPGKTCKCYVFTGDGVSENAIDEDWDEHQEWLFKKSPRTIDAEYREQVVVPASFMQKRSDKWEAYCKANNLTLHFDHAGSTAWGRPILDGLRSVSIPALSMEECVQLIIQKGNTTAIEKKAEWWHSTLKRINTVGVPHVVYRKKHRAYHSMVWCPGAVRRLATFEGGQKASEIDLKTSYFVFLAKHCTSRSERHRLIQEITEGDIYSMLAEEAGIEPSSREVLKREVLKQVLFFPWHYPEHKRVLFGAFARLFPSLGEHIRYVRNRSTASEFSAMLMRQEADLFIDGLCPLLGNEGIPCLTVHDSVVVPANIASLVREELEDLAEKQLGFVPRFSVKTN